MKKNNKKISSKDTQAREYQLTVNNPMEKGMSHEELKKLLNALPNILYWCMCDEIGVEKTPHTHIYFKTKNPIRFSTIKNKFPTAHIEKVQGTSQENRDYIRKEGKWKDSEKQETNLSETFEEWGTLPKSKKGHRSDFDELYSLICDGFSNAEILKMNPSYMRYLSYIEKTRQTIIEEKFKDTFREIECTYVFGATNTNKTRTYTERYGYTNVYRITNYTPSNSLWDSYKNEDAVIFEEYRSQLAISDLLVYLEGYPNSSLRARYSNKVACYTKVILISNIPLEEQYQDVQHDSPETWKAFLRRINTVTEHKSADNIINYGSVQNYLDRNKQFQPLPENVKTPFDTLENEDSYEQETMPFDD